MSIKDLGIEHKRAQEFLAVTARLEVKNRAEVWAACSELAQRVPAEVVAGPAFCTFQFISSVQDGFDVEIGIPVTRMVEGARLIPTLEVLSLTHQGPAEQMRQATGKLYGYASQQGIISDEFYREIYHDVRDATRVEVEIQFVIHDWNGLLAKNLARVLGQEAARSVMQGSEELTVESTVQDRFEWVKSAVERLEGLANEAQRYDILSSCAHVFPASQIAKLRAVYVGALSQTGDPIQAVDAVIDFMDQDPGWGERPRREGQVIYSAKKPRDPQGYETAQSELERRQAYCFCPLIRTHLESGMPIDFCYCGSGWYRQQWEGTIDAPVQIDIVQSILRGDERCEFAIRLPIGS